MQTGIFDDYGDEVKVGDHVNFSYGIPPVGVHAPVVFEGGDFWVLTPRHNPKKEKLSNLAEHVGSFLIAEPDE